MATKSVIEIEVRDEKFKAFAALFEKYTKAVDDHNKKIKQLNDGWAAIGREVNQASKPIANFLAGVEKINKGFHDAEQSVNRLSNSMKATDRTVGSVGKSTYKIASNIASATLNLSKWAGFGLIGGLLGGAGGMFGISALAGSASATRRQALGLGISAGDLQAAKLTFQKYGNVEALLGGIAGAKSDVTKQWSFSALGLNTQTDTAKLLPDLLRKARDVYRAGPEETAQQRLDVMGLSAMGIDLDTARRLSKMRDEELEQDIKLAQKRAEELAIQDETLRRWQDFKITISSAGTAIENLFLKKLESLTVPLGKLSDSFKDAVQAFLDSKLIEEAITWLSGKMKDLADYMKKDEFKDGMHNFLEGVRDFVSKLNAIVTGIYDKMVAFGMIKESSSEANKRWEAQAKQYRNEAAAQSFIPQAGGTAMGDPQGFLANVERSRGLPAGTLDRIWSKESGRGNPEFMESSKGAKGHFGFMPDTAREWGVQNPYDFQESAEGAANYFQYLYKRYGQDYDKAMAAYNWGMGNLESDIKQHGESWREHLPDETLDYMGWKKEGGKVVPQGNQNISYNSGTPYPFNPGQIRMQVNTVQDPNNSIQVAMLVAGGYYNTLGINPYGTTTA